MATNEEDVPEVTPEDAVFEIVRQTTTVNTDVRMTLRDGTVKELNIPHFEPKDQAEVEQGIKNRFVSETRAHEQEKKYGKLTLVSEVSEEGGDSGDAPLWDDPSPEVN